MRSAAHFGLLFASLLTSSAAHGQAPPPISPPDVDTSGLEPLPTPLPRTPYIELDPPIGSTPVLRDGLPEPLDTPSTTSLPRIQPPDAAIPDPALIDEIGPLPGTDLRPSRPKRSRSPSVDDEEAELNETDTARDVEPSPPPPRRGPIGGLLARITGRRNTPPPRPADREEIVIDPNDPDAAELERVLAVEKKRRIENEIKRSVGDRVSAVEVIVVGRRAHVRARATRFFQRRGVRRSIEQLPSLRGLQATVEVN